MGVKKGLGRGIDAIFAESGASPPDESGTVRELRISEIEPNRNQARKSFEREALEELAASIAEHGVISPVIVKAREDGVYRLIAGERRWRASKLAGKTTIPALIVNYNDRVAMEVSLIENLQREDLNPIEESEGYQALAQAYGLSQEEIAKRVGKSRPAVANALRLLSLPEEILVLVRDGRISAGHARALLACKDKERMLFLAQRIIKENLSVRKTEQLAPQPAEQKQPRALGFDSYLAAELEKKLAERLGRKVSLRSQNGKKGVLELEFYGSDDLGALLLALGLDMDL